jgi:sugar/nucleoside kinase (ribokinase family)
LKVDVENISILNTVRTRSFHVSYFDNEGNLSFASKKRCPFCNKKKWYEDSLIDTDDIIKNINDDDILVFDNLNNRNQIVIDNTSNKKIINLGQYFELENLFEQEIIEKLNNKFEIINFNEKVTKYLSKRLNLNNDIELYNLLKPNFMTVTRGENGATFINDGNEYNFKGGVVDSTGAGDAFIFSIIKDCIKNNFNYNPSLFEKWYENSNKLAAKVVSKMGARGHINALVKVKKKNNECTCDNFEYNERKK